MYEKMAETLCFLNGICCSKFLFIGANIDAIVTAEAFGIEHSRAVNYHADKKGTKVIYDAISAPLTAMRSKGRINDNWSEEIEEDFNNRK